MDTLPGFGKGRSAGKDAQRGGLCGGLCLSEAVTKKFELIERETKGPSRVNHPTYFLWRGMASTQLGFWRPCNQD